jgi:single-strand DNA-binding protein
MNKVILIGHVGKDPEVRYLDSGTPKASFTIATTKRYKNKAGERVSETAWHNIILWRKLAEIAEKYIRKGALVLIEGEITYRSYEDREGVKRFTTEIICTDLEMLGRKEDSENEPVAAARGTDQEKFSQGHDLFPSQNTEQLMGKFGQTMASVDEKEDDLPF